MVRHRSIYTHHTALPRLYGGDTPLVRVVGKDSAPTGNIGDELYSGGSAATTYTALWQTLLLGNLPVGYYAGYLLALRSEEKKVPFLIP